MSQIEIIHEEESAAGWTFTAQVLDSEGGLRPFRLRLAWADYNLWSPSGSDEPARVAEAVIAFLLSLDDANDLPDSFDASLARRKSPDADAQIPQMIR